MCKYFASLDSRSAVITGASSGIGRAIALAFAKAGGRVLITCRNSYEQLQQTAEEVAQLGPDPLTFVGDLASQRTRDELVDFSFSELGNVSAWVNNCGADILTGANSDKTFDEKLRILLDVDLQSTIQLSRPVAVRMKSAGRGSIINIGWDQAATGMGGDSGELFSAVKNAIMGFSKSLALSFAPEVRVNCIAPGWIQTAWGAKASDYWQERVRSETPLQRWGLPEDIANLARFLASDEANFITGQVINVNGGAIR